MRRRSRASSKIAKARSHKAMPKRRNATTVRAESESERLRRERDEALEREKATAEVLRVISLSPGELRPVFQAILENAVRICKATFGNLYLREDDGFRAAAMHNAPPAYAEQRKGIVHPSPTSTLGRAVQTKQPTQTPDITKLKAYVEGDPWLISTVSLGGYRAALAVPMLHDDELIGTIIIYRQEIRPFTDKQIALVQNFAAQAVIAIENARLLNELRQRTDDLSESLERQTATSEVLKVISSSPGDLQPVFDTILANATQLCDAGFASLRLSERDQFRTVSLHNAPTALTEHWRSTPLIRPHPESALGRTALTKQVIQTADAPKSPAYSKRDPLTVAGVDLGGYRTTLSVPMLREDVLVGAIAIYRQEVRPFTEKQIALVQNFAAQAVIAIENARLLNELRQRTDDLSDALEQQTATSEVLRVISNSLSDTQPVFESIVRSGVALFSEAAVCIALVDNGMVRAAAVADRDLTRAEAFRSVFPFPLTREYMHSKSILDRKMLDIPDVQYAPADLAVGAKNFLRSGYRAVTIVPLMRGDQAIGALSVVRVASGPLSDKQLATLKTYADQAVIAIENARLLNELRQSLQQQTATADVLKVISRSTFNLQTVLDTLVESAEKLCDAEISVVSVVDGE